MANVRDITFFTAIDAEDADDTRWTALSALENLIEEIEYLAGLLRPTSKIVKTGRRVCAALPGSCGSDLANDYRRGTPRRNDAQDVDRDRGPRQGRQDLNVADAP